MTQRKRHQLMAFTGMISCAFTTVYAIVVYHGYSSWTDYLIVPSFLLTLWFFMWWGSTFPSQGNYGKVTGKWNKE